MKDSYFYYEARHYQMNAQAYAKEAIYWLDRCVSEPDNSHYHYLAKAYQYKAAVNAREARHYLMLAINPNHYKQLSN